MQSLHAGAPIPWHPIQQIHRKWSKTPCYWGFLGSAVVSSVALCWPKTQQVTLFRSSMRMAATPLTWVSFKTSSRRPLRIPKWWLDVETCRDGRCPQNLNMEPTKRQLWRIRKLPSPKTSRNHSVGFIGVPQVGLQPYLPLIRQLKIVAMIRGRSGARRGWATPWPKQQSWKSSKRPSRALCLVCRKGYDWRISDIIRESLIIIGQFLRTTTVSVSLSIWVTIKHYQALRGIRLSRMLA